MPSFGSHSRNYSWPPSLHHVSHLPHITQTHAAASSQRRYVRSPLSNEITQDVDMDEDPYSHFISPIATPEDDQEDPMMMMTMTTTGSSTAGIHNTESLGSKRDLFCANLARRWARSIRAKHNAGPSSRPQTLRSDHDRMAQSSPRDYSDLEVRTPSWASTATTTTTSPPKPDVPHIVVTQWDAPTQRSRAQSLLIEARRLRRRRRTSRTLSGHRHSWQEPSPDLYTVLEEGASFSFGDANDDDNDVAVESGSDADYMDTDEEDEELNSEDEALYAEDDDFELGWPADHYTRPPERARL